MAISEVRPIPLDDLDIGPAQARMREVGKEIDELAASIQKIGLLEPIVVSPLEDGRYEILTGQRRFLAHRKLGESEILCAILDRRVDEAEAKAISLTENLLRRDLNRLDLIDACTWLFKKYGTIKAVVETTGIAASKVSEYVKYDRLIPELKGLVDDGTVPLKSALRAQDAATGRNEEPDASEAIQLAKEMAGMSGPQVDKLVREAIEQPDVSTDDLIEDAKTGGKITQILVTLSAATHSHLQRYASDEVTNQDDAAAQLIQEALAGKGYAD